MKCGRNKKKRGRRGVITASSYGVEVKREREGGVCDCVLYLLMPDDEEEEKGFPPNREFRCSWDDVLVSTVTGFCSGI